MIKFLYNSNNIIVGITLKNTKQPEAFNTALHTGHEEAAILHNRTTLASTLNVPLERFVFAEQTHSDRFFKVEAQHIGLGTTTQTDAIANTDALYTFEKNVVLSTFTADCVPVLFHEPSSGLAGVIHSGWQGTVKEITPKLLHHLKEVEKVDTSKLIVWLGPALSQERFEVDADVYTKFAALHYALPFIYRNEQTNKYHIDNQKVVQAQLEQQGVIPANIHIDRTCTYTHDDYFSYRQQKSCGRHLSFLYVR